MQLPPSSQLISFYICLVAIAYYTVLSDAMTTAQHQIRKGVTYHEHTGEVVSCIFCRITNKDEPATIVYEDQDFVAFKTIAPATANHLLICPRKHIQNLNTLSGPTDAKLVQSLIDVGTMVLGADAHDAQFSFHVPPFNSIDHLHLHAIGRRDTMGLIGGLKYWEGSYWCKGAKAAMEELERTLDRPAPAEGPPKSRL